MKKGLILTFILFSIKTAFGQSPIISFERFYQIGDKIQYFIADSSSFNIGTGGANKDYDFSTLKLIDGTFNEILKPSDVADGDKFTNATCASEDKFVAVGTSFYKIDTSGVYMEGLIQPGLPSGTWVIPYTDNAKMFNKKMTYGDTLKDNLKATYNGFLGTKMYRNGKTITVADGYGKLILPNDTLNDIVRFTTQMTFKDSGKTALGLLEGNTVGTFVTFMSPRYPWPLMQYFNFDIISSAGDFSFKLIEYNENRFKVVTSTLEHNRMGQNPLKISSELGSIKLNNTSDTKLQVVLLSLNGKIIKESSVQANSTNTLRFEEKSGIYILRYYNNKTSFTQKIYLHN